MLACVCSLDCNKKIKDEIDGSRRCLTNRIDAAKGLLGKRRSIFLSLEIAKEKCKMQKNVKGERERERERKKDANTGVNTEQFSSPYF